MRDTLTIRLSPEAKAALQRLASQDSRSMASWIEQAIRREALAKGAWNPRVLTVKSDHHSR